ncbi:UDP-N-acetylglucosamine--N-acetylmuramyl-(pentapeptide) pyrophosphoryl-undecaprenol N-acetylglucosamine transferase [Fundidesulfovibrio magnetotacticus]|uniref:UDP-N-acetylglucosamine--N-acetylmuramyl-(Pentapeptide) pyrophosphoryl-undecaprenol N-acetylglucosamine transferase n=1 Tax=Fundidesulfovibrio magnetotacticus TaxID=2730080 RepID=A0A6V8LQU7_9BACT|nr:UDP-2,4-diacetamido-2,4,6-trideoxy-beta-L-altropyranose hydrolase [Fundidesulfovibrio magnetotacticus]GFK94863.1 UDP-N-acetylglucosamine--N-acetylmuramyl-(pentapeptide) pyrophosphoryl-undecaprenol N-acetylglucosamine transferase [Fundidesulfovibrio magnetotacticus]
MPFSPAAPESAPGWLVIRADAGPDIGIGHVMRCLALAQAWMRGGGRALLAGWVTLPALVQRLEREGVVLSVPDSDDPDGIGSLLRAFEPLSSDPGAHWIVLDGYGFNPEHHAALRRDGRRLLVLDDQAHLPRYHADAILNQNIGAQHLAYDADPGAIVLTGPAYALLREELRAPSAQRPGEPDQVRRVLVTMGGADPDNTAEAVLRVLSQAGGGLEDVVVVAGPANPHLENLRQAVSCAPFPARLEVSPPDMAPLLAGTDLALSAAGSTAYELCLLGVPMALAVLAPNQRGVARGLEAAGAAVLLGETPLDEASAANALAALLRSRQVRQGLSRAGQRLVDGQGADRVVERLLSLSAETLRLRPASQADSALLLAWRNDPETIRASLQDRPVSLAEHNAWFAKSLADPSLRLYVAELEGRPAGTVRLNSDASGHVLSWTVAPSMRGQGVGKAMVRLAVQHAPRAVRAEIRQGNIASVRIALHAGLSLHSTSQGIHLYTGPGKEPAS